MEKFSAWRDEGTGIPPFLPERQMPEVIYARLVYALFENVFARLLGILLLPFFGLRRIQALTLARLYGLGYDLKIDGVKKRDLEKNRARYMPSSGILYVVNSVSPFDAYLLQELSGHSAHCNFIIPRGNNLNSVSPHQWYEFALDGGLASEIGNNIDDFETFCNGKINYLFAEGTTSNGKSILPFEISQVLLEDLANIFDGRVQAVSLKLNAKLTTSLRPKSLFWYKLGCISQRVRYKVRISEFLKFDTEILRASLAGGDKYRLVGKKLGLESKRKFSEVYYQ